MINYKAIADEAEQYVDYQTAFTVMSAQTTAEYKELSSNALRTWAVENAADFEAIEADSSVVSRIALEQIKIDSSPLDMTDATTRGLVSILPISDAGKANLLAKAEIEVKVWSGLKAGHVQNALQKRAKGEV